MAVRKFTLPKQERLSLKRYMDVLFKDGQSFVAYPFRLIYYCTEEVLPARVSVLVSVPKKKFKRAVKRNHIKRLLREAYRLHKYELIDPVTGKNKYMMVAFLFLDKELPSFENVEKSVKKAVRLLIEKEQLTDAGDMPAKEAVLLPETDL